MMQKTVAEKMITVMGKIGQALHDLKETGIPRSMIVVIVAKEANLSEKTIEKVLLAVEEVANQLSQTSEPVNKEVADGSTI